MRLSLRFCIFFVCLIFTLTATGIAGLALYRYSETVQGVTALYDKAFEGVDYAHKAREGFMDLMASRQNKGFSFAHADTQDKMAAIKENLDTANELTFSSKDVILIRQIKKGLADLPKSARVTESAAEVDKNMNRLIGRYTAARIDSKDTALAELAESAHSSNIFLSIFVLIGMLTTVLLIKAILPPIRRCIAIAEAVASGKLDNNIEVRGMTEIAQLLGSLSVMQEALFENIRQIETARKAAVQSEVAKGEFLANMSHELRTPLNNILGSVQLLHDRPMPDKDKELFTIVERSSKSLLGTVNDILDLSKLEAGEVHLERIEFDVYDTIRNVTQLFLPRASKKGIVLSCQSDMDNLPVLGDSMRVEGVLNNLLGNAMRYTERGSINVRTRAYKAGAGKVMVRIEIYDSGIGIPKDRQQKIFERFTQADSSTTRRYGGTGLGLTITKQLVELMKGKIGVESEVGKGSMFWFEIIFDLPTAESRKSSVKTVEAVQTHENAISAGEAMVLVAEDHELNRAFMKRLFENLGVSHFVFAENGLLAVEQVQKRKFDVVLMDCQMPEMDGYEATATIRALPDQRQKAIPIIAMTANAMASDKERCLKAGMDSYISKPFDIEMFKRTLSPWVNFGTAARSEKPADEASAAPADMEFLVDSIMGDEYYLKVMISLFVATADEQLDKLKAFILEEKEDHRPWMEAAHGLKGAAAIVGAEKLRLLAAEAQIMEDVDRKEREKVLNAMQAERDKLTKFFLEKKLV